MNILLVGHGGREHALLETLHRDRPDARFFITRGNAGTAKLAQAIDIAPTDVDGITAWADGQRIDLIVVGPEAPLAAGLADACAARGLPVFGPSARATEIEASKVFAKRLMQRAGVHTAAFETFSRFDDAREFIHRHGAPLVVKASGLAAGKGAIVCASVDEAEDAARAMLVDAAFGSAGREIVIEQFLQGEELSIFALTDGERAVLMPATQDHKRIGEGDTGPNTGGMGAYLPVSIGTPALLERARNEIFEPVLAALKAEGRPFRGLLYGGLMVTDDGPHVIEFNARFGDPETQALLPLLDSSLLEPMLAVASGGTLAGARLAWKDAASLTTVLATAGYPESSQRGLPIHIPADLLETEGIHIFHAGTKLQDSTAVTDGGRVLAVTAVAPTLDEAAARSRRAAASIDFEGKQFRRDIGWRELQRHARTA